MMKPRETVLAVVLLLACGLTAFVFVSRGRGEHDVIILEPKTDAPPPVAAAPAAAAPTSSVPEAVGMPAMAPIGSVVGWMRSATNTPSLPRQWVECNGQALNLPGSPYHGTTIPNLNGAGDQEKRFLRGSVQSGAVGGAENHNHGLMLIDRPAKRVINVSSKDVASNLPPYYEVTWIMRVL